MLIVNCTIVTCTKPNSILLGQALKIDGRTIKDIGPSKTILSKYSDDEILDAKGQFVFPGLICAHTHFYGAFSRGMAINGEPPASFPAILRQLWWPLDQSLTKEDIYFSSLVCLIDAIKHGTTTIFDHHASPNFIAGSLDVIESAFLEAGIRGSVCYEVTDRGGKAKTEEGISENLRMIDKIRATRDTQNLVTAMFGLHAGLTLSEETLSLCSSQIPSDSGFHIHVAEHTSDEDDSRSKAGTRAVQRLHKFGITGKKSIFVHGVHLNQSEIDLIKQTHTWLTHQPRSNMNNAVGMANVENYCNEGIPVCLGNDGFSFAMWDEWRTCYLAHKSWNDDPRKMPGNLVFEMGINNNAALASHFFGETIGSIEIGAVADLILVDYQPFTKIDPGNLPWHMLFGFRDSMVTTTIVNGKILMLDRKLLTLDEKEICEQAQKLSTEVWKRYNKQIKIS